MRKDRFSEHSRAYAAFRPTYSRELYQFLLGLVESRQLAWDVGCGNGQVAFDLAAYFDRVIATDMSAKQLQNARQAANLFYQVAPAEESGLDTGVADLITVGQALHWFDTERFFQEVKRVAKPHAVVAAWGYGLLHIHPQIDTRVHNFYTEKVGSYWDAERRWVDEAYQRIRFPFAEIQAPSFSLHFEWTREELFGYLSTWSAVRKYMAAHQQNPVEQLMQELDDYWHEEKMPVRFPVFMRVGRVLK
ncbi:MAG: class I SAM-dependent methyltransferase [Bacteroidota bacterium]